MERPGQVDSPPPNATKRGVHLAPPVLSPELRPRESGLKPDSPIMRKHHAARRSEGHNAKPRNTRQRWGDRPGTLCSLFHPMLMHLPRR